MTKEQITKLLVITKNLIGKPYRYGARPEDAPAVFDCSSFTQYIFKQIGIELPRSAILQAADPQGQEIIPAADFSNLEVGDLLFMRSDRGHYRDELFRGRAIEIGHVVIHVGGGVVINARSKKGGVLQEKLDALVQEPHYNINCIKRF